MERCHGHLTTVSAPDPTHEAMRTWSRRARAMEPLRRARNSSPTSSCVTVGSSPVGGVRHRRASAGSARLRFAPAAQRGVLPEQTQCHRRSRAPPTTRFSQQIAELGHGLDDRADRRRPAGNTHGVAFPLSSRTGSEPRIGDSHRLAKPSAAEWPRSVSFPRSIFKRLQGRARRFRQGRRQAARDRCSSRAPRATASRPASQGPIPAWPRTTFPEGGPVIGLEGAAPALHQLPTTGSSGQERQRGHHRGRPRDGGLRLGDRMPGPAQGGCRLSRSSTKTISKENDHIHT